MHPLIVVQVSDIHVHPDKPESLVMHSVVRDTVTRLQPALVVFSGDISADGHVVPDMLSKVKKLLDGWGLPWVAVPGNHDVGNRAGIGKHEVTPAFLKHWIDVIGDDRFAKKLGCWLLLGLDTQVMGSGLPSEKHQLDFLDAQLQTADRENLHVAVFQHMPAYLNDPREHVVGKSAYWVPTGPVRDALVKRLHHPRVKLVASGHVHWHANFEQDSQRRIWCPASCDLIVDDSHFPRGGGCTGFMKYTLTDNAIEPTLIKLPLKAQTVSLVVD